MCTPAGTIFDLEIITTWLDKHATNPVDGQPLALRELIKLNFARNSDAAETDDAHRNRVEGQGDFVDPVTYKVFTDNTHIVAIRHGQEANVFAWETVERLNVKAKMWRDLVNDKAFGRSDIITLQDPQNVESRNLSTFQHLAEGNSVLSKEQLEERQRGSVNVDALGRVGERVLRAKEAVEKARRERAQGLSGKSRSEGTEVRGTGVSRPPAIVERKVAYNAAQFTTGRAAASFTSTGLTPETSGERAVLSDEEYMLKPKRVKIKGYARIETNFGSLHLELQTETAPRAVWNFVQLAKKGYYNGVSFHRNIRNFMIQGGDPTGTGKGGSSIWGRNFADEFDGPLTHDARGMVSMANKGKNTNSSQFFITYRAATHLNRKHTIFGRITDGLDVLQKLEAVPVDANSRPLESIVMDKVVVYVDPFEEFQKQRRERDEAEQHAAEVVRQGGTEDDRTTWTGKRIRGDGTVIQGSQGASIGKYLPSTAVVEGGSATGKLLGDEEEPVRKKVKAGGFANFDNW